MPSKQELNLKGFEWEIKQLKERVLQDERDFRRLKERLDDLENRIRVGKGIVIGFCLSLGTFGVTFYDKIDRVLTRWLG